MRLLKTLFVAAAIAAFAVPAASAQTPHLLYNKQITVKPGQQFKAVFVGRNVTVTHDINCVQNGADRVPAIKDFGSDDTTLRLSARAWSKPCIINVQVYTSQPKRFGYCAAFKTRAASTARFAALTCQIPAATPNS